MKKLIFVAIALTFCIGAYSMSRGPFLDRINPFLKIDTYYTIVKTDGKDLGADRVKKEDPSYQYVFTGYNSEGKEQKIIINITKKLRQGAYLEVNSKGESGKNWGEVQPDEIPKAAKVKLGIE